MLKRKLSLSFMLLGVLLICGAISLFLYNKWDENRASEAAIEMANILTVLIEKKAHSENPPDPRNEYSFDNYYYDEETDEYIEVETLQSQPMPSVVYDGKSYIGLLDIPALNLTLPILETWSDAKLKVSPCRYVGDPRQNNMVVMAHNYTKHFGSISLLQYGDPIVFTDANGEAYQYTVAGIETVNSTDIQGMVKNDYDFTMFTCTYGGQARIAVRCVRVLS